MFKLFLLILLIIMPNISNAAPVAVCAGYQGYTYNDKEEMREWVAEEDKKYTISLSYNEEKGYDIIISGTLVSDNLGPYSYKQEGAEISLLYKTESSISLSVLFPRDKIIETYYFYSGKSKPKVMWSIIRTGEKEKSINFPFGKYPYISSRISECNYINF